jgi:hypothetical protein
MFLAKAGNSTRPKVAIGISCVLRELDTQPVYEVWLHDIGRRDMGVTRRLFEIVHLCGAASSLRSTLICRLSRYSRTCEPDLACFQVQIPSRIWPRTLYPVSLMRQSGHKGEHLTPWNRTKGFWRSIRMRHGQWLREVSQRAAPSEFAFVDFMM